MTVAAEDFPNGVDLTAVSSGAAASVSLPTAPGVEWILTEIDATLFSPPPATISLPAIFTTVVNGPAAPPVVTLAAPPAGVAWVVTKIEAIITGAVALQAGVTISASGLFGAVSIPAVAGSISEWSWDGYIAAPAATPVTVQLTAGAAGDAMILNVTAYETSLASFRQSVSHQVSTGLTNGPVGPLILPSLTGLESAKDTWSWSGKLPAAPGQSVTITFDGNNAGNTEILTVKAYPIG